MFCKNCGKEVNENADACLGCGLNPNSENNYCSECGEEVKNQKQVICLKCGVKLDSNNSSNTVKASRFNDKEYSGLYRSSDDKILSGICGGLAHKYNQETKTLRIIAVVALFIPFTSWLVAICYLLSFLLPSYPTKV